MSQPLNWQCKERVLSLQGELVHSSLVNLWQQRAQILQGIDAIDLSQLSRVDSAGLALLVHFSADHHATEKLRLQGVTPSLLSLIRLYNLQGVLLDHDNP
ncbi:lipid asymmetry maintenance protein MlaB [Rosenbergiella australiborealis]|uniref:Lipid asymmetry maintenance protein MlaB n=1 Tax=Rosenbergiella australiborealis TaxID=1544696 RepID=A0ABS5T0I0_9GAMM|nr:lipid asymmetry maintenance protein MlaB [Rosenbergiella australiborealis]MBT0725841.1 lipid asymmetry maintenance protein MlaB [Rosenbergiella australiborealis]